MSGGRREGEANNRRLTIASTEPPKKTSHQIRAIYARRVNSAVRHDEKEPLRKLFILINMTCV